MGLLVATLLTASVVHVELDLGGLLGATWYVPAGRARLDAAWAAGHDALLHHRPLDVAALAPTIPLVGAWFLARPDEPPLERAALVAAGLLQGVGLMVGLLRLGSAPRPEAEGLVLRFSPIAAGQLGLSVRVVGF